MIVNYLSTTCQLHCQLLVYQVAPRTASREVAATGAVNVQELTRQDWEQLEAWQLLKPLERRRVFCTHVPPDRLLN